MSYKINKKESALVFAAMDELFPNWHNDLNIETLNISSIANCALSMAGGEWYPGKFNKNLQKIKDLIKSQDLIDKVFANDNYVDFWINEIKRRRGIS